MLHIGTEPVEEEEQIKETKATIRCIPLDAEEEQGISLITENLLKRVLLQRPIKISRRRLISSYFLRINEVKEKNF